MATTMTPAQVTQFRHVYSKVLVEAWTDPSYFNQLKSNPKDALKAQGLALPANATVEIKTSATGSPDFNSQVKAWEQGNDTNNYVLYVPDQPQLGKGDPAAAQDTYCCCCSPCCTCT